MKTKKLMRWAALLAIVAIAATVAIAVFVSDGDSRDRAKAREATQTVMIYMVGSDLESVSVAATDSIRRMMAASHSTRVNVVLTTGGANRQDAADPVTSWRTVRRYVLRDGKLVQQADLGRVDMAESKTLSDFVVWARSAFPAEHYQLFLWGHGAAYRGFGGDENFAYSVMDVPRLSAALYDARAKTGVRFDLIGFDACMMANVEVAAALVPYANYLVGSQELEPGDGWNYTPVLSALAAQPGMHASDLGRTIVDSYLAYHKELGDTMRQQDALFNDDGFVTLAVLDLKRFGDVKTALSAFASALSGYVQQSTDNWLKVARLRAAATSFGGDISQMEGVFDMVDIAVLADHLAAAGIVPEASRRLSSALRQSVVYRGNGALVAATSGVSMYFPSRFLSADVLTGYYDRLDVPKPYKALLHVYVRQAKQKPALIQINMSGTRADWLEAAVTSTFGISDALEVVSVYTRSPGVVRLLASQPVARMSEFGHATMPLDGQWLTLNGHPVIMSLLTADAGAGAGEGNGAHAGESTWIYTYGVPVLVNGKAATLAFRFDGGTSQWTFAGTWRGATDGVAARAGSILPTDRITPMALDYDLATQQVTGMTASSTTFAANRLTIAVDRLKPGKWQFNLLITDLQGGSALSAPRFATL